MVLRRMLLSEQITLMSAQNLFCSDIMSSLYTSIFFCNILHLCVCVCVCVCARVHANTHVCMCLHTHACVCVFCPLTITLFH